MLMGLVQRAFIPVCLSFPGSGCISGSIGSGAMIVFELEALYNDIKRLFEKEEKSVMGGNIANPGFTGKFLSYGFSFGFPLLMQWLYQLYCVCFPREAALAVICQQMVKGISSFSLMAVPFFITMGVLMGSGGISEKLIALANACVGWMRGGMAMVNIVASYFFGGISGSAAADTASLGSILIPMMVDQGMTMIFQQPLQLPLPARDF